jgi:hypothetical protein
VPDEEPTVATPVLPLAHTPPPSASLNVVVEPEHTVNVPVIGALFTVTGLLAVPQVVVYVMDTLPFETPVTIPVDPTVAMPVLPLLHVP